MITPHPGKMLTLVVLSLSLRVEASGSIYYVDRQEFAPSQPPVARALNYQLVTGYPAGIYQVHRQDFGHGNAPFAQNSGPTIHSYLYPPQRVLQPQLPPTPSPQLPPRLFVPAEYEGDLQQPNYHSVLSLSEYNRRLEQPLPSYPQPSGNPNWVVPSSSTLPPHLLPSGNPNWVLPSSTSLPLYPQPSWTPNWVVLSSTSLPLYSQPSVNPNWVVVPSSTSLPLYHQPSVNPNWLAPSSTSSTPASSTTESPTNGSPYSPLLSSLVTSAYEDDGVLPPIPANDEEGKPLPPISEPDPQPVVIHKQSTEGTQRTTVKYHSFNEFVEISDEQRDLLESFGSIQNNESDFAELPEASPIRGRRETSKSQETCAHCKLLTGTRVGGFWQKIMLGDIKPAARNANNRPSAAKSPAQTIVATDDSAIVVFNGDANFGEDLMKTTPEDSSLGFLPARDPLEILTDSPKDIPQASSEDLLGTILGDSSKGAPRASSEDLLKLILEDSARGAPRVSSEDLLRLFLEDSANAVPQTSSEDLLELFLEDSVKGVPRASVSSEEWSRLSASSEVNSSIKQIIEAKSVSTSSGTENWSLESHEQLLRRDGSVTSDAYSKTNPLNRIIYLPGRQFEPASLESDESWGI